MLKHAVFTSLFSLSSLLASSSAWAASFDCERASTADEKAVCANRVLNDMDVSMALLFSLDKRFLPMGGRDALIDQQQAWIKTRAACGANVSCLKDVYQRRIDTLRQIIDTRVVTQGPF